MARKPRVPSYRRHKAFNLAVVTIRDATGERRDVYLGVYDLPESRAEYGRVIAEQAAGSGATGGTAHAPELTVDQVLVLWWKYANEHYRRPDGTPTNQIVEYKSTLAPVQKLYGHTLTAAIETVGVGWSPFWFAGINQANTELIEALSVLGSEWLVTPVCQDFSDVRRGISQTSARMIPGRSNSRRFPERPGNPMPR